MSAAEPSKRLSSPVPADSQSTHQPTGSLRSNKQRPSQHTKVITAPPWAQYEPPSPDATLINNMHAFLSVDPRAGSSFDGRQRANSSTPSRPSNSDVASLTSSNAPDASHWWTFNLPLPIPLPLRKSSSPTAANSNQNASTSAGPTDTAMREKPRAQWLFDRVQVGKDEVTDEGHNTENAAEESIHSSKPSTRRDLRLTLPKGPFTVAQTKTPGWDTPWAPASPAPVHMRNTGQFSQFGEYTSDRNFDPDDLDPSAKRKLMRRSQRTLRGWLLHNSLVPLFIRLLNASFTTATLAVAISIRQVEKRFGLIGAVGSSPILAIIFAPLTLVHVIVAIYLEYFGRPLGLWRTSAKLLHTLLEMLFVCMWSASLSLCFDNYFTSPLQCAPSSATYWWNELARETIQNVGRGEGGPADEICERQFALVCLVFLGLTLYCSNLIISLFRIFEKVKFHGHGDGMGHV